MVIKEGNERMENIQLLAKAIDELEDRIETLIDFNEADHGADLNEALNEAITLMVHHRDFMVEELDKN
tara:strand:- start:491 stop:694 length:204 start_codon:yes stop_codon:yes gene_type:complete